MTVTDWQKLHCMGESQRRRGNGRRPGLLLPPPRTSREALERPQPLCSSLPSPALEKKGASREGRESFQEKGEGRQPGKKKLFVLSSSKVCVCTVHVSVWFRHGVLSFLVSSFSSALSALQSVGADRNSQ